MKKIIVLSISFLICMFCRAQKATIEKSRDEKNGSMVLTGTLSFEDLWKEKSFSWMRKGARHYRIKKNTITPLKEQLKGCEMCLILGTWCGDSKEVVPHLYKLLRHCQYDFNKIKIYGVDRKKEAPHFEATQFNLLKIPTLIIYKNRIEIGRIVEQPDSSLEDDLLKILTQKT